MKIGIFGGSFNPPHKMHKNIVRELIKKGYLNKIIIVPTADNYNKPYLLSGIDRINMLQQLFKDDKKVEVSSFEVDGSLYTINTLNYFRKKYPKADIYFICGTDNLAEFNRWHKFEQILSNYKLLVVDRDTNDFYKEREKYKKYKNSIYLAQISPKKISSTEIRKHIMKKGFDEDIKKYLYVDTIKYLKNINLKDFWT